MEEEEEVAAEKNFFLFAYQCSYFLISFHSLSLILYSHRFAPWERPSLR